MKPREEVAVLLFLVGTIIVCAMIWPEEVGTRAGQMVAAFNAAVGGRAP
jgi:hypothetical protein